MITESLHLLTTVTTLILCLFLLIFLSWQNRRIDELERKSNTLPPLEEGSTIHHFDAVQIDTAQPINSASLEDNAKVFMFLSTYCDKCKSKLPEISKLTAISEGFGVSMRIISDEPEDRLTSFIEPTPLQKYLLMVKKEVLNKLNPIAGYPYYLFIDQNNILKTQGLIGDDNWQAFVEQLTEE